MLTRLAFVAAFVAFPAIATSAAGEQCPVETGVQEIYGEPMLVRAVEANRPVLVRTGAVIAQEAIGIGTRIWRSEQRIAVAGQPTYDYPPGVPVTALRTAAGERRCLRHASQEPGRPARGRLLPCLVDRDGDGLYEAAELFPAADVVTAFGRTARWDRGTVAALVTPVRLTEDSAGLPIGRSLAIRRVSVVSTRADGATVELAHASILEQAALRGGRAEFTPWPGSRRSLSFVDGAVETIGGIRFRIGRSAQGWTLTPLDERFPRWIRRECEGSTLTIGRP